MKLSFYRKVDDALRKAGVIWPGGAENMKVARTRSGRHQKAAGALSWFLITLDNGMPFTKEVGGYYPASELKGEIHASVELFTIVLERIG